MVNFRKPSRLVDRVFLHCSASDNPGHDSIEVMRDWHVNGNNWSDVGYHYFIRKNGTVEEGRSLEKTPAAQKGHNQSTIAICCHGLKVEKFTTEQYKSVIDLCRQIKDAYEGEVTFHGHCEVSAKTCPVYPYQDVLGLDEDGYMVEAVNPTPTLADDVAVNDLPVLRLFSRGASVKILQTMLNQNGNQLVVDGIFSGRVL